MKKLILNKQSSDFDLSADFVYYVKSLLQKTVISSINNGKLVQVNKYLTDVLEISSTAESILHRSMNSLKVIDFPNQFVIKIDTNKVVHSEKDYPLYLLCSLINDGNMDIKGYPIIDNCISFIESNIKNIYANWISIY